MSKNFSRKELERLGCNEDEVNLVIEYQKKLPILTDKDEVNGFCVNARLLHSQLGVSKKFASWIKSNVKNYEKETDYITSSFKGTGGEQTDFILTIDVAKEIAMSTGTMPRVSQELKDNSRLTRKYFILMEKIVKDNKEWWSTRNPEKKDYNNMCEAVSLNIQRACGRTGDKYDYAREANILNRIATGSSAQSIRNYFGLNNTNELTRDSLEKDYNQKIAFLQKQNIICLGMNMPIVERVKFLISAFDITYPTARPLLPYMSRDDMDKARLDLINELQR